MLCFKEEFNFYYTKHKPAGKKDKKKEIKEQPKPQPKKQQEKSVKKKPEIILNEYKGEEIEDAEVGF